MPNQNQGQEAVMLKKHDNTNPGTADWEEACREISKYAPEHYGAFASIQPFLPQPAGTTDSPSVYFTQENAELLNSLIKQLSEKTAIYCTALMRLYNKANSILPQNLYIAIENQIPAAITEQHIAPRMDRRTLSALMSTCSFFYTRESLQTQRDAMPKYQICVGSSHTLVYDYNKLLVCGDNSFGQLGMGAH